MSDSKQWYVVVDDASPKVNYQGDWSVQHNPNARNTTLSVSRKTGSSASFRFAGNYVAVYGAVLYDDVDNPPISTYSIDGQTPAVFIPSLQQNNTFTTFFVSPQLADSEHTLEVLLASDNAPILLDSILFNATTVAQVTSGGLQPTIITTIIIAPPSSTATVGKTTMDASSVPIGPIVGGVIGGLVLLVSAILAFYFLYWKPKRSDWNYHVTPIGEFDDKLRYTPKSHNGITPFQVTPSPYSSPPQTEVSESIYSRSSYHPADATNSPSFSNYPPPPGLVPSRQSSIAPSIALQSSPDTKSSLTILGPSGSNTNIVPPVAALTPAQRKALEARSRAMRPSHDPVLHADSGYRFDDSGSSTSDGILDPEMPKELPPTYSER